MIVIKPEDVLHKSQLFKLLIGIVDHPKMAVSVFFKGGTCASMLGFLDRFSIDLDFDLKEGADKNILRLEIKGVFKKLNFSIENENDKALLFILKYAAPEGLRNTLKLSISDPAPRTNTYKPVYLPEIDRQVICQTIETMFANKLVAPLDRYQRHEKIAGRDIYDIHYFFSQGYSFRKEIIEERTDLAVKEYLLKLIKFIEEQISETIINEDLNMLLPYERFQKVRKTLKPETLIFLKSVLK